MNEIPREKLIEPLQQSLGIERAQSLLEEACQEVGVAKETAYSQKETKKILEVLGQKNDLLKIISLTVRSNLILKRILSLGA